MNFQKNFQKTTLYKQLKEQEEKNREGQDDCSICLQPMPSVRMNKHTCYECLLKYTDGPKDSQGRLLDPVTRQPLIMCHKGHPRTGLCGFICRN